MIHPIYITPPDEWLIKGGTNVDGLIDDIIRSQARAGCEYYLESLEDSKPKSLEDIIEYNKDYADKEFDEGTCHILWPVRQLLFN